MTSVNRAPTFGGTLYHTVLWTDRALNRAGNLGRVATPPGRGSDVPVRLCSQGTFARRHDAPEKLGGFMAQLRLPDLATRLQGLAVAPDRPRWVYAGLANLRRGAPPTRATASAKLHSVSTIGLPEWGVFAAILGREGSASSRSALRHSTISYQMPQGWCESSDERS